MSGKSMIISPRGKIAVQASSAEEEIMSYGLSPDEVFTARRNFPCFATGSRRSTPPSARL
jgi:predicted amidohydrolase